MGNPRAPDPVSSVGDDVTVDEAVAVVSRVDMDDDWEAEEYTSPWDDDE